MGRFVLACVCFIAAIACDDLLEDRDPTKKTDRVQIYADSDQDQDGFTPTQGDCKDIGPGAKYINPSAVEELGPSGDGDGVDDDCDGLTDEQESCDCGELPADEESSVALALGMCDQRFFLGAEAHYSSSRGYEGYAYLSSMGDNDCLVAQEGCKAIVLSTGKVNQVNPNFGAGLGGLWGNKELDPLPEFQGNSLSQSEVKRACDVAQITIQLKAPSNAHGFSFQFLFGSSEYAEFVGQDRNDAFYAIMVWDELNGGATTNISFDPRGKEIEVDANFFENEDYECDEFGSGWEPEINGQSGTTGWLRTSWDIKPGAEFTLTFSIHDEVDCTRDSIVFLDDWRWLTQPVTQGTVPIV